MKISDENLARIINLCKKYKVKHFSVFGSALRDDFSSNSDIDFIVDFDENDPILYTDLYYHLKDNLERVLKRKIDLVEARGIKNTYLRNEIEESKVVIYGQ